MKINFETFRVSNMISKIEPAKCLTNRQITKYEIKRDFFENQQRHRNQPETK